MFKLNLNGSSKKGWFIGRLFKRFSVKLLATKSVHSIISNLFYAANREIYKRTLRKTNISHINLMSGYSDSVDWIRMPMYNSIYNFFQQFSKKEDIRGKTAIEIGGSEGSVKHILEKLGVIYVIAPNFPEVDIHCLPYDTEAFDFIVLDQVLEHVEKPGVAVNEIWRVLRPGGICVVTTPFFLRYHASPPWKDYYRYTIDGLRVLFSKFEILEIDGWGNVETICASLDRSVINTPFGSTIPIEQAIERGLLEENDPAHSIVMWCIAKKPKLRKEVFRNDD